MENNMKTKKMAVRYAKPEYNEMAPYMTIVKVVEGTGGDDERVTGYYIQTAKENNAITWQTPKWMNMGEFLQKVFEDKFEDREFIDMIVRSYEASNYKK